MQVSTSGEVRLTIREKRILQDAASIVTLLEGIGKIKAEQAFAVRQVVRDFAPVQDGDD